MSAEQESESVTRASLGIGVAEQVGAGFPHQLSGVQRRRVAICRGLVRHARLVIAD